MQDKQLKTKLFKQIKIINMNSLKEKIKSLSQQQGDLKVQRKTVNFEGDRKLNPTVAAAHHAHNRHVLRWSHAAYAILRGKDPKISWPGYGDITPGWEANQVIGIVNQNKPEWDAYKAKRAAQQAAWEASKVEVTA